MSNQSASGGFTPGQFVQELKAIDGRFTPQEVFEVFLEFAYGQLATMSARTEARANRLVHRNRTLIHRFGENQQNVMTKFVVLSTAMATTIRSVSQDFLGAVHRELTGVAEEGSARSLSPAVLAGMCSRLQLTGAEIEHSVKSGEPISVLDRSCGTGAAILDLLSYIEALGLDPWVLEDLRQYLVIIAVAQDPFSFWMTYIQMELRNVPAIVIHGDFTTYEEADRAWTLPAVRQLCGETAYQRLYLSLKDIDAESRFVSWRTGIFPSAR